MEIKLYIQREIVSIEKGGDIRSRESISPEPYRRRPTKHC